MATAEQAEQLDRGAALATEFTNTVVDDTDGMVWVVTHAGYGIPRVNVRPSA